MPHVVKVLCLLTICILSSGCFNSSKEPVIKYITPTFIPCVQLDEPMFISYKDETMDSDHNFSAFLYNTKNHVIYEESLRSTIWCYESQIENISRQAE